MASRRLPHTAGRPRGGFTLIELIMVMVLIGILATYAAPKMLDLRAWRLRAAADQLQSEFGAMQRRAISQRRPVTATLSTSSVVFTDASGSTLASWSCPPTATPCIAESGPRSVVFNSANSGRAVTSTGVAMPVTVGSGSAERRLQIEHETGVIRVLP